MTVRIITGDCRDVLRTLPGESVHCCITSPPYWGLRDYQIAPSIWGGEPACEHEWGEWREDRDVREQTTSGKTRTTERFYGSESRKFNGNHQKITAGQFCLHCNAWRGAHGLEPDYQLYVDNAVTIFREVWRVLRKDGTLWLNLGDSYASGEVGRHDHKQAAGLCAGDAIAGRSNIGIGMGAREQRKLTTGLPAKNLLGIPWRVAFALQADGWWLRQDIIWSKPNPMPESVTDRCTKAHEYLFLLSKSERYYYDAPAIAESAISAGEDRGGGHRYNPDAANDQHMRAGLSKIGVTGATRNRRSVWEIATQPYSEAHFATFPPALIEPCIKAGTSEKGCCSRCGAPWVRDVIADVRPNWKGDGQKHDGTYYRPNPGGGVSNDLRVKTDRGFIPSCTCNAATVPCTVLDPFFGAGTTGLVADRLQRNCIGIEKNESYAVMARRRITDDAPLLSEVAE